MLRNLLRVHVFSNDFGRRLIGGQHPRSTLPVFGDPCAVRVMELAPLVKAWFDILATGESDIIGTWPALFDLLEHGGYVYGLP